MNQHSFDMHYNPFVSAGDKIAAHPLHHSKLAYFRKALKKRFPQKTMVDIDMTIEQELEAMHPCRNRTLLNRAVIARLSRSPSSEA
jgi:hypothetical protein